MMEEKEYLTAYQTLQEVPNYASHGPSEYAQDSEGLLGGEISSSQGSRRSFEVAEHTVTQRNRRWGHIADLDQFFNNVYKLHQLQGLTAAYLVRICEFILIVFTIFFTIFFLFFINTDVLYHNKMTNTTTGEIIHKSLAECIYSWTEAMYEMHWLISILFKIYMVAAVLFLVSQVVMIVTKARSLWQTSKFYETALKITKNSIQDVTWDDVKKQLMEVQLEQGLCPDKEILTPLDIAGLILRTVNYKVALITSNCIPVSYPCPFVGEMMYFTKGIDFNVNIILFKFASFSFMHNCDIHKLKDVQYKKESVEYLKKIMKRVAWVNVLLCPFIFVYNTFHLLYNYIHLFRIEPGSIGGRQWSLYGRYYLRHYNELEHEQVERLNRAYKPASAYLNSFRSRTTEIIAHTVKHIAGAFLFWLFIFAFWDGDDDMLGISHVVQIGTICGFCFYAAKSLIPDENLVFTPERHRKCLINDIHYMPSEWAGKMHTSKVRAEFSKLFQFKLMTIIEEFFSPLLTPIILIFWFPDYAEKIVDFFRMYTVKVQGIGNVCSFAQLNVKVHGTPSWQPDYSADELKRPRPAADDGRTEFSLVHFALNNPDWKPLKAENDFLKTVKPLDVLHENTNNYRMETNPLSPDNGMDGHRYQSLARPYCNAAMSPDMQSSSGMYDQTGPFVDQQSNQNSVLMGRSLLYLHDKHQERLKEEGTDYRQESDGRSHFSTFGIQSNSYREEIPSRYACMRNPKSTLYSHKDNEMSQFAYDPRSAGHRMTDESVCRSSFICRTPSPTRFTNAPIDDNMSSSKFRASNYQEHVLHNEQLANSSVRQYPIDYLFSSTKNPDDEFANLRKSSIIKSQYKDTEDHPSNYQAEGENIFDNAYSSHRYGHGPYSHNNSQIGEFSGLLKENIVSYQDHENHSRIEQQHFDDGIPIRDLQDAARRSFEEDLIDDENIPLQPGNSFKFTSGE